MTTRSSLWRLFNQGRFTQAVEDAVAIGPTAPDYATARLVAVRAELARGRVTAATHVLDGSHGRAFAGEDGDVLRMWQTFVPALTTSGGSPHQVGAELASAAADESRCARAKAEALGLLARWTTAMVRYDELPISALRQAEEQYRIAADAYGAINRDTDRWRINEMRALVLRAIPGGPVPPVLELLADNAAEAAHSDPIAEGTARLAMLRIRLEVALDTAQQFDSTAVVTECAAVADLLASGEHAFGGQQVEWTVAKIMLRHGLPDFVDVARQCADAFTAAGATHLAHEVWQDLAMFYGLRGEGEQRRSAAREAAAGRTEGEWATADVVGRLHLAEAQLRSGNLTRAQAVIDAMVAAAPHRQARTSLRIQQMSRLCAVGLIPEARRHLTSALADLAPVRPTPLTGEVLAQLAQLEIDEPSAALEHASEAVESATQLFDREAASRYLRMRADLRIAARRTAGLRPFFTEDVDADLVAALEALHPVSTVQQFQAAVGIHQARAAALFFDNRPLPALDSLRVAETLARRQHLGVELAFVLMFVGTVHTILGRQTRSSVAYDSAVAAYLEAREHFLRADMNRTAWHPLFMAANALWEKARNESDVAVLRKGADGALQLLGEATAELDVLRGVAGGLTALQRQQAAIGFARDKQQAYELGFRIAVHAHADPVLAIGWLEAMKSRALLEALASAALPDEAMADNPLLRQEWALEVRRADAVDFAELTATAKEQDELLDQLALDQRTSGYATLRRSTPPSWPSVRAALRTEQANWQRRIVVAQYHAEPGSVLLFGMAPDWEIPKMVRIPCAVSDLAAFSRSTFRVSGGVRMMMQDHADGGLSAWQSFASLVAPIADWAAPDDVVYLVPYGGLHDLPLHTLNVAPGTPLGFRNSVCYAPSLALLSHSLVKSNVSNRGAAVFGDPGGNLQWAAAEAVAVARTLGAAPPMLGADVTRDAVLTAVRDRGIVHLAGQARAAPADGLASYVELAGDAVLRAGELLMSRIGADLVVLSGCESGVSQHHDGDEAVGLVRALLHGGARTLLTSQWRVRDDSARDLLTAFHRNCVTMPRADALRIAMRADGGRHFYHWGGFVLTGYWR